jgi:hypothetical protein
VLCFFLFFCQAATQAAGSNILLFFATGRLVYPGGRGTSPGDFCLLFTRFEQLSSMRFCISGLCATYFLTVVLICSFSSRRIHLRIYPSCSSFSVMGGISRHSGKSRPPGAHREKIWIGVLPTQRLGTGKTKIAWELFTTVTGCNFCSLMYEVTMDGRPIGGNPKRDARITSKRDVRRSRKVRVLLPVCTTRARLSLSRLALCSRRALSGGLVSLRCVKACAVFGYT